MIIEEEEIKTEIKFFDKEDDTSNAPEQAWRNEEETEQEYSLFSIDEEGEDPNDLEIQSFSFDFENKKKNLSRELLLASLSQKKNRLNSTSL